jgi:hypothetical protein
MSTDFIINNGNLENYTGSGGNIIIPKAITNIGTILNSNYNIKSIEFEEPSTITVFEDDAFGFCENLSSITIPSSIETISNSIFFECVSLATINVNANNKSFMSENNVLFNINKTILIKYAQKKQIVNIVYLILLLIY